MYDKAETETKDRMLIGIVCFSRYVQPASRKDPAEHSGAMSNKQEGLDNFDSSNPYINEPGKSVKGEGETESTKLKGTVSTERPQE